MIIIVINIYSAIIINNAKRCQAFNAVENLMKSYDLKVLNDFSELYINKINKS